jgi:hypothetical protein
MTRVGYLPGKFAQIDSFWCITNSTEFAFYKTATANPSSAGRDLLFPSGITPMVRHATASLLFALLLLRLLHPE